MIIKEKNKDYLFCDILIGEVCRYKGELLMAVEFLEDEDGGINCVNLSTGEFECIDPNELVEKVEGFFQIT